MAFIPEDKLLEIKDAARIEEVVGQYVQLTQKGKNLLGLCPFHADTSPSFTVAPEKGIFHCFGCGAGGNVFSFLMLHQRLSFPEAVQELARRYGIPISLKELGPDARSAGKRTQAYEINKVAASSYEATLASAIGAPGRDYLATRGLTPEVIKAFHLGYAPEEWESLRRHLQTRGLDLAAAQDAGLLMPRTSGGFYDRFRDRIIFPIFDRQSRVIAFGGRSIGQGEPKYLNSPESQLYSKGRTLYGLPQAAEALRHTGVALVVEGYLDLIALQVKGISNVLATLGTALTREQVRLLKSLADKVVLVYDGDAAGIKAMQRALPLFAQESLPVRALALPAGQDPDDYARSQGVEIFKSAWGNAQPWFTFLLEGLIATHGLDVEGRVRILEELRPYFQAIADPVEQDLWRKAAAQRLGVDEGVLRQSLSSFASISASRIRPAAGVSVNQERALLRWVLVHPQAIELEELELWALEFETGDFKELLALIIENYRQHGRLDHGLLVQRVEREDLRRQICALTLTEEDTSGPATDLLADHWHRDLEIRRLKKVSAKLKERLQQAAATDRDEELTVLLAQRQEIDRQLDALKFSATAKGENG
ncbi:MAG: DNA primase [Deltaproteobacteria bacterium]|nr:DNA primase [Deltaproteobacteria bacterium]